MALALALWSWPWQAYAAFAIECSGLLNITGLHKYGFSYTVNLTGDNESDETKERVAEPKDDAWEDNVSCERLNVIQTEPMLTLSSTDQLCWLLTTNRKVARTFSLDIIQRQRREHHCYKVIVLSPSYDMHTFTNKTLKDLLDTFRASIILLQQQ